MVIFKSIKTSTAHLFISIGGKSIQYYENVVNTVFETEEICQSKLGSALPKEFIPKSVLLSVLQVFREKNKLLRIKPLKTGKLKDGRITVIST
eukprot:Pgem_evm2s20300